MAEEKKSIARPSAQEISKIPVGSLGLIRAARSLRSRSIPTW